MDTSTLTIVIVLSSFILVIFLIILYKNSFFRKQPKLSYNEKIFLEANLELGLNDNSNLTDRYVRASGREKKNDFKGAIEDINVILQHDHSNVSLIFKRGLNKFKLSDYKEALSDFNEVIDNNPSDKYS